VPYSLCGRLGRCHGTGAVYPLDLGHICPRIAAARGKSVANPWDPQDAIMAMSFLLADNGASAGGYTADFNAAARYYAGWNGPNTTAGRTYASQVMAKVTSYSKTSTFWLTIRPAFAKG
jgi:hypothetical protein